jgi:DNA-binding XRE family transcriptional regulator
VDQHGIDQPWFWLLGNEQAGHALGEVRREAGLTQAQIAAQLDMDRTTVLNMEAGRNPAIARFIELFRSMGYDLIAVPHNSPVRVDIHHVLEEGDDRS